MFKNDRDKSEAKANGIEHKLHPGLIIKTGGPVHREHIRRPKPPDPTLIRDPRRLNLVNLNRYSINQTIDINYLSSSIPFHLKI